MYKLSIILLSLIAGSAFGASTNNLLRSTEINLLQLMVDTRADQRANPEQSLACFDYYLKVFDDLNEEYRLSFAACLDTADVERRKIDAATQPERDAIEKSANSSCEALNVCANLVGSIEYFSCFSSTVSGVWSPMTGVKYCLKELLFFRANETPKACTRFQQMLANH